ncbi:DNA-3-methyladenine glycosylase family protein [Bacillus solimangrovi]|uniref:DNA-3-methyladenine glycosylase II n=1 Tax=Bacillus solimangrovi TaxID=1305675 RepID=A0A1E5LK26_9BACI|nr:DNA-3-methyladenine glycosylase [Bacillus solimangrovi]OEH94434.1 DNA-3-methyladenine glycosylase [Bacillus solimangrovi]
MEWIDHKTSIEVCTPKEFNFEECLVYLDRSELETLHQVKDGCIYKLLNTKDESILVRIRSMYDGVQVDFPLNQPSINCREEVASYIWEWFDLERNISPFYDVAKQDRILQKFSNKYYGLRMIGIPDLFEALTWAIIGQQINLTFAYTLKKRFIEQFGKCINCEYGDFWLFPTYQTITTLEVGDLRKLQFSVRKAEYIIEIAKNMSNGNLTKEMLLQMQGYEQIKKFLMKFRGIGAWTADYVMMRCLRHSSAFPLTDVGIHNALKLQLELDHKPSIIEIKEMMEKWKGWEAYSAFYLWRSLYE